MTISDNIAALAKRLIGLGVPAWFIGLIMTENFSFGAGAAEIALATLLMIGGMIAIAYGLAALVVGAAISDIRKGKD